MAEPVAPVVSLLRKLLAMAERGELRAVATIGVSETVLLDWARDGSPLSALGLCAGAPALQQKLVNEVLLGPGETRQ